MGWMDILRAREGKSNKNSKANRRSKLSQRPIFELTPLEQRVLLSDVHVNFQANYANSNFTAIPSGYLEDAGYAYGDRANGHSYGWTDTTANYNPLDNSSSINDRNSSLSADQRYDTGVWMDQGVNHDWKIALPNGTYHVHLVAGDANYSNTVIDVTANGTSMINGTEGTGVHWLEGTHDVTVSNGFLVLAAVTSVTYQSELSYLDISPASDESVAPGTAPSGVTAIPETSSTISLQWTSNTDNQTSFQIQRSTNGTTFSDVTTSANSNATNPAPTFPDQTYFGDSGLTANTTYYYRVRATNSYGSSAYSSVVSVRTPATNVDTAFPGGPLPTSAPILAKNFDTGGEGVSYHDLSTDNWGGEYRETGVDITTGAVGYAQAGEYLKYQLSIPAPGTYTLSADVASTYVPLWSQTGATGGTFSATFSTGTYSTLSATVPNTGGWSTYQSVTLGTVTFAQAGTVTMTVTMNTNASATTGMTGKFLSFSLSGPPTLPTNLAAVDDSSNPSGEVDVSWSDTAGDQTGFILQRSTDDVNWTQIGGTLAATATSYADTTVAAGTNYYYKIEATNASGNSGFTPAVSVTTAGNSAPAVPSNVSATPSGTSVLVSWSAASGASNYGVDRSTDGCSCRRLECAQRL